MIRSKRAHSIRENGPSLWPVNKRLSGHECVRAVVRGFAVFLRKEVLPTAFDVFPFPVEFDPSQAQTLALGNLVVKICQPSAKPYRSTRAVRLSSFTVPDLINSDTRW